MKMKGLGGFGWRKRLQTCIPGTARRLSLLIQVSSSPIKRYWFLILQYT